MAGEAPRTPPPVQFTPTAPSFDILDRVMRLAADQHFYIAQRAIYEAMYFGARPREPTPAQETAKALFLRLLRPVERRFYEETNTVVIVGRYAKYRLTGGTNASIHQRGEHVADGCFMIANSKDDPAYPYMDHMLANYLVLRNNEDYYWRTANIHARSPRLVIPPTVPPQHWAYGGMVRHIDPFNWFRPDFPNIHY